MIRRCAQVLMICAVALMLSACHQKDKPSAPQKVALVSSVTPPKAIPKDYHAVSVPVHTSRIGTVDAPTIDGGIINAADGIPIEADPPPQTQKQDAPFTVLPTTPSTNNSKDERPSSQKAAPLNDNDDSWVTDNHVKAVLARAASEGKLDLVLKDANAHHLPASVALVPIVESAYESNAVSPKGAAGDWQIMPATAKDLGLTPDERFDFARATDGALTMLQNLHERFGNWTLTFAAYNAGAGRVARAQAKHPGATSLTELGLPPETVAYVARIHAVSRVLASGAV